MIIQLSPNFDDRPEKGKIKYLILHYSGMATGEAALKKLCDGKSKVSAHYLIEEDGRVFSLVPEEKRAWHAGVAAWEGDRDINGLSIGIEMVNPGHDSPDYKGDYRPFPAAQMAALVELAQDILSRHEIASWHILGHSDVAPDRKRDPGELFNWNWLASEGIGLWPFSDAEMPGEPVDAASFQQNLAQQKLAQQKLAQQKLAQQKLAKYGYKIDISGIMDQQTRAVIRAFQRHFRPADVSGTFDEECHSILEVLLGTKDH